MANFVHSYYRAAGQEVERVLGMCPPGASIACEQQPVILQDPCFEFRGYAVLWPARVQASEVNVGISTSYYDGRRVEGAGLPQSSGPCDPIGLAFKCSRQITSYRPIPCTNKQPVPGLR